MTRGKLMGELQWWCVARGETWSWTWTPYPGVWLFVGIFASFYWTLARPGTSAGGNAVEKGRSPGVERTCAITGLILLWLTLDWPVGALGAGYLASVHSLQFVMLAMVVPVLLLFGVSDAAAARLARSAGAMALVRRITSPLPAAVFFTIVMAGTHASVVLDRLMKTQLGNFSLDMLWLVSGIIFAWPLVMKAPVRDRFGPPVQILYIFGGTVAHVFIGMWLLSSQFPAYATYELAPRIGNITAITDQHLAGAVILLFGTPLVLAAVTWIFFRWQGTGAEKG